MGIFDDLFGSKATHDGWKPTHRALLKDVSYDELIATLGSPQKAKGLFVYWREPLSSLDPDYDENQYFQVSNKDFRGFGDPAKKPMTDRENWFIMATSAAAIRIVANEVGALARNIEKHE